MTHNKTRRAFTMMELIIVVAIIGMLVTIAIASYAKIQARARRTKCRKNIEQLVGGVFSYAKDNNEFLPPHQMSGGGDNPDRWWGYDGDVRGDSSSDETPVDIWGYVGTEQVFMCPGKANEFEMSAAYVGYGYNAWFLGWDDGSGESLENDRRKGYVAQYGGAPIKRLNLASVLDPSSMLTFGDSVNHSRADKKGAYVLWYPDIRSGAYDGVDMSHGDMGCAGFLDGHTGEFENDEINPTDDMDKLMYWDPRKGKYPNQP